MRITNAKLSNILHFKIALVINMGFSGKSGHQATFPQITSGKAFQISKAVTARSLKNQLNQL